MLFSIGVFVVFMILLINYVVRHFAHIKSMREIVRLRSKNELAKE